MTKLLRLAGFIVCAIALPFIAQSQSVSINTTGATAAPSAMLDVTSTAKGMLVPRMDKTQKNAIAAPANGLLVYQTGPDSIGFHYYDQPNAKWVFINASGFSTDTTAWKLTGNSNATASSFLGTTNDTALRFRIRNIGSGIIDSATNNTGLGYKNYNSLTTGTGNSIVGYMAGKSLQTGSFNSVLGRDALSRTGAGTGNVAVGDSALGQALSQSYNVAVGALSSKNANNNVDNVAIGIRTMENSIANGGNIAIGTQALRNLNGNSFYTYNTAIGHQSQEDTTMAGASFYNSSVGAFSLQFQKRGGYNVAMGISALRNNDSTSNNTAIGGDAMYFHRGAFNTSGSNVAVGAFTNRGDSVGYWNTALGSEAMDRYGFDGTAKGTGFSNVAVGFRALRQARQASENTAVGVGALESDSSGNYNSAMGRYSSFLNKRGDFNVSIGYNAASQTDSASNVTALGSYALTYNKQDNNVGVGWAAGYQAGSVPGGDPKEITFVGYEAGRGSWASNKNTAVGFRALSNTNSSFGFYDAAAGRNTVMGDSALAFSIGASNTAIGAEVMSNTGLAGTWNNVAIGDSAMGASLSNGGALFENVAVGYKALTKVKNQGNIAVGAFAGNELGNTIWNTAIGYHALETDTTGSENTVIGTSAFRSNARGIRNVSLGINTGYWATGDNNTYIGSYAGQGVSGRSTGGSNVAVGDYTMLDIRSGSQNVAMGESALASDSSGNRNVSIGAGSLENNLRGSDNVVLGFWAGRNDTASSNNVYIGRDAAYNNNRSNIVAIGYQALYNNGVGATASQGLYNTAVGHQSLTSNKRGIQSTAMGYQAMQQDTSSGFNTAIGAFANRANTSGIANTSVGSTALDANTTGGFNTAVGQASLSSHIKNDGNVAIGSNAMMNDTTGANNTAVGLNALQSNSNGGANTALGAAALDGNTTGTSNTAVGYFADVSANNLTNATALGNRAMVGASNSLVLGSVNGFNGSGVSTSVGIGTITPSNSKLNVVDTITGLSRNASHIIGKNSTNILSNGGTLFVENAITGAASSSAAILAENENTDAGFGYGAYVRGQFALGAEVTARATPNANITKGLHVRNNSTNTGTNYGADIQNLAANAASNYGTYSTATGGATSNYGVLGQSTGGSITNYGVYGAATGATNNYGLFCSGSGGYTGTWTLISDQKFKKDIQTIDASALASIQKLNPVSYLLKGDEYKNMNFPTGRQYGFVAQELEKVFPILVENGSHAAEKAGDGQMQYKSVNYIGLIPVLTKAIQEQQTVIEDLKKKNEQLEKDMQLVKAKLGIIN